MMDTWLKDELTKISESDDLHVSPFREDGVTYGTAKGGANHCAVLPAAWYPHVVIYELATHNHFEICPDEKLSDFRFHDFPPTGVIGTGSSILCCGRVMSHSI